LKAPETPRGYTHVYNQFTIRTTERDALRDHLTQRGIPTEIYYPKPLHLQRAFAYLGHKAGDFPVSGAASSEVLSLPIYPELTEEQQRAVVAAIADFDTE
jgi:dTDP-4-amino-4,6-dideoxygalactose transaminase